MKAIISAIVLFSCTVIYAQYQVYPPSDQQYFTNPVFAGDYPDPSILRDGEDYYITFSSFHYYPGLPIWHSKDLINWTPVAHGITKNVGSVFAPDLVKHDGIYYIYFPANRTNWVVWASSIEGPWSEPIDLKVGAIDPGHVVDENGKRYMHLSSGLYVPLSDDGLSVTGERVKVYEGWQFPREWTVETFALESPKLMKHGEYYYMTSAQGGTAGPATSHMVVSARSESPLGPWENSPYNPIIRTGDKSERWWSKGHGTPFEDKDGKWWIFFHGYENGYYQMGRQTLLQPLEWTEDGWFRTPEGIESDKPMERPGVRSKPLEYDLSDDFSGDDLGLQWQFFKEYDKERFQVRDNSLILKGQGAHPGESAPLLCIPQHHSYTAQVEIEAEAGTIGGLVLFYYEEGFIGTGADKENIYFSNKKFQRPKDSFEKSERVYLRMENREGTVDFFYSINGKDWMKTTCSFLVSSFNHNAYGGFLSLRLGLYATGEGTVTFRNFKYEKLNKTK